MTKMEFEKRKRGRILIATAIGCTVFALIVSTAEVEGKYFSLIRDIMTVALCIAVFTLSMRYLAVNDEYRVVKEEVIKKDGQMPFSRTFYFVEHNVFWWWVKCRDKNASYVKFHKRKEAEAYMQSLINEWNKPLPPLS